MNEKMNEYILKNKTIFTTEERYETTFKKLGYVPVNKNKEEKVVNKDNKKLKKNASKKIVGEVVENTEVETTIDDLQDDTEVETEE